MTTKQEFQHPRFAQMYVKISDRAERLGATDHRRRLLEDLSGRIIEIGSGHGLNFRLYPPAVTEVVAVEPDDTLREIASSAAERGTVPITVVTGHAEALPAADGTFDGAVASLVLCTVPRLPAALAEIARVLRPGAELRFYEHVRSDNAAYGVLQDIMTPIWSRAGGGCHPNRDTPRAIEAAGFVMDDLRRFPFRGLAMQPASAHVIGQAHKP
jgi:ubiquinone/menaquinone biosynthesis C-methylase UbiE